jgi:hypothetical protein
MPNIIHDYATATTLTQWSRSAWRAAPVCAARRGQVSRVVPCTSEDGIRTPYRGLAWSGCDQRVDQPPDPVGPPLQRRSPGLLIGDRGGSTLMPMVELGGLEPGAPGRGSRKPRLPLPAAAPSVGTLAQLVAASLAGTRTHRKPLQSDDTPAGAPTGRSPANRHRQTGIPGLLKIVVSPVRARVSPSRKCLYMGWLWRVQAALRAAAWPIFRAVPRAGQAQGSTRRPRALVGMTKTGG